MQDFKKQTKSTKDNGNTSIVCQFATIEKLAHHPQEGIPLMYHDQMNIVANHIFEIKSDADEQNE